MHLCEAQIACFEALGDKMHLDRATEIAHKLCVALPTDAGCYGTVCEHYTNDWKADPEKNKGIDPASEEYIFRPFGFQPGHSFEWCKLILMIERLNTGAYQCSRGSALWLHYFFFSTLFWFILRLLQAQGAARRTAHGCSQWLSCCSRKHVSAVGIMK